MGAAVVRAASPITLDDPGAVRGRRVLVVEDGPTTTHGGMPWGAGYLAAKQAGADVLCLCDTNGGTLTTKLEEIVADVAAFLAGTTNHGWLLKLAAEGSDATATTRAARRGHSDRG